MSGVFMLLPLTISLFLPTADACGGFFCDRNNRPIDQTGEKIVFAIEPEGDIETHVQIAYEGTAQEFAWLVPVPTPPELFISTDELFDALDATTAPIFNLSITTTCEVSESDDTEFDNDFPESGGAADSGGAGGVRVIEAPLGPYETAVLQGESSEAIHTWLTDNGYTIPADVAKALDPYVAEGSWFVALRLQKDRGTGDLAPLGMRYAGTEPIIPLVLTSIAATPDMRLIPYVLGDGRAVPDNYLHVVPNELAIDWLNGGRNYPDLITRAADAAGGQAFATDYAGTTSVAFDRLFPGGTFDAGKTPEEQTLTGSRFDSAALRSTATNFAFLNRMLSQRFVWDDRLLGLLRPSIPNIDDLIITGGGDTGGSWSGSLVNLAGPCEAPACYTIEPGPVVDLLEREVIRPLHRAEHLLRRHDWITRLVSSVSPDEMDLDPRFVINTTMPEIPQTRQAAVQVDCVEPWRLTLPSGRVVDIPGSGGQQLGNPVAWNTMVGEQLTEFPAERIEQTGRSGDSVVLSDFLPEIRGRVPDFEVDTAPKPDPRVTTGCGCDHATPSAAMGLALAAAIARRRRR